MSGLKTIRRRIVSVTNTKQITRAMKLVSAAKLRKAQDAAIGGRAYSNEIGSIVRSLISAAPSDFNSPLTEVRKEIRTRRIVVISGERGLCGAYNTNIVKAVTSSESDLSAKSSEVVAVGFRSVSAATRLKWNTVGQYQKLPENVALWPIDNISDTLIKDFCDGACDEVVVYFTKFISGMSQKVIREVLLPIGSIENDGDAEAEDPIRTDPSAVEMLKSLLPLYVRSRLRQAVLESKASEHAARMTAMDSATSNADDLIGRLRLYYNRARQSSITRELIDIVGGAEAIK